ncbi:MAG TPA: CotH kinase family protein, partial [Paludibacteraceae bacterium]|nr:CotH kinase family protein [Paludibacteraceae bacterium]
IMRNFLKLYGFLLFFVLGIIGLNAQSVSINEIMSSNSKTITDEDGSFEDWIELYNYGDTPVNLHQFGLSDNANNRFKWTFPEIMLPPQEFLLVFASDKDRKFVPMEEQVLVSSTTIWKYVDAGEDLGSDWKEIDFDDTEWKTGTAPLGYNTNGNERYATVLDYGSDKSNKYISYQVRTLFEKPTADFRQFTIQLVADDGIIVYLNGKEIIRQNMPDGEIAYTTLAQSGITSIDTINYQLDGSLLQNGTNTIAVSVHQVTLNSSDIYFDMKLWTNKQYPHANFKIASEGETLFLTNKENSIISNVASVYIPSDISYGRTIDGNGDFAFFATPTPGTSNITESSSEVLVPVNFSHNGGVYTEELSLTLSHPDPEATIIYTIDGSIPSINNLGGTTYLYKNEFPNLRESPEADSLFRSFQSYEYTGEEILVYDKSAEDNQLSNITTSVIHTYLPDNPIRKGFVVQAKAYKNGAISSHISGQTYFIWEEGNPYNVPIISLQIQEDFLFDYNKGLYTPGADWDNALALDEDANPCLFGNYISTREYPAHVEIFDPLSPESDVNQGVGVRIHGGCSRLTPIKSLRLYARNEYDRMGEINYNPFSSIPYQASNPSNTLFKRMLLRFSTSGGPQIVDIVTHKIMESVYPGVQRTRHAIEFINGEFWGITAIRDRFDQYHLAYNYNLDSDNIIFYTPWGIVDEGLPEDKELFTSMYNYISTADLSTEIAKAKVESLLDIQDYFDYYIMNIYFGKVDWYGDRHFAFWRVRTPVNSQFGDGRFRTFTWDFDTATSLGAEYNMLHEALHEYHPQHIAMINNLLTNEQFKYDFINRFADHLNTTFLPERVENIVHQEASEFSSYLPEHNDRWPNIYPGPEDINDRLIQYAVDKSTIQRTQIMDEFGLSGTYALTIDVSDKTAGSVRINSIDIQSTTPGVSDNPYPWSGVYFSGIPVKLTAIPKEGYRFSHWSGVINSTSNSILVDITNDDSIQANFVPIGNDGDLIYFWLINNTIANDTPLSEIPATFSKMPEEYASLEFSSCLIGYPFNSTHSLWRKASMERKNAPTSINYFPEANNNRTYGTFTMRALQIKEPFQQNDIKNTLYLNIPTTSYKDIIVSFAAKNEGAANGFEVDYWDINSGKWEQTDMNVSTFNLYSEYQRYEILFKNVLTANDNPDFRLRIGFTGATPSTEDNGNNVVYNNFAVQGTPLLITRILELDNSAILTTIFPNPASNYVKVYCSLPIIKSTLINTLGITIPTHTITSTSTEITLDISQLSLGGYILLVETAEGISPVKFIKR